MLTALLVLTALLSCLASVAVLLAFARVWPVVNQLGVYGLRVEMAARGWAKTTDAFTLAVHELNDSIDTSSAATEARPGTHGVATSGSRPSMLIYRSPTD